MISKILRKIKYKIEYLKEENKSVISEKEDMQLSIFQLDDPTLIQIKDELTDIDINTLTPVEALMKLNEIKKLIGK